MTRRPLISMWRLTGSAMLVGALHTTMMLGPTAGLAQTTSAPTVSGAPTESLVFQAALEQVAPAIVRIDTLGGAQAVRHQSDPQGGDRTAPAFRQADGPTTGLIWSADGYIVTSSFNFLRAPAIITVALADGRRLVARLIARDYTARLALLRVSATDLPTATWRGGDSLRAGQWALAAGYGHESNTPAMTAGIVSAVRRMSGLAVQTDAKISPANYGGPLFDIDGRVIGICVPIGQSEDQIAGVDWYDSGIGFAVAHDVLQARVERLKAGRDLHRGLLGVVLDTRDPAVGEEATDDVDLDPPPAPVGLRIQAEPRGPASEAGLAEGDVIVSVDDVSVPTALDLRRVLARKLAGDEVRIEYRRAGETAVATLRLAAASDFERPAASQPK